MGEAKRRGSFEVRQLEGRVRLIENARRQLEEAESVRVLREQEAARQESARYEQDVQQFGGNMARRRQAYRQHKKTQAREMLETLFDAAKASADRQADFVQAVTHFQAHKE